MRVFRKTLLCWFAYFYVFVLERCWYLLVSELMKGSYGYL